MEAHPMGGLEFYCLEKLRKTGLYTCVRKMTIRTKGYLSKTIQKDTKLIEDKASLTYTRPLKEMQIFFSTI